jgi:hypothetical protein
MAKSKEQRRKDRKQKQAARQMRREPRFEPELSHGVVVGHQANGNVFRLVSFDIHPDYGPECEFDLTEEQKEEIDAFTEEFLGSGEQGSLVERAEDFVRRYPQVPQLKTHLVGAYGMAGRKADVERVRQEMLEGHPDYLFSKLLELHHLMDENRHDEVRDRFGAFALDELLNGRTQVNPHEMLGHCLMAGRFAVETGELRSARASLKMMESIAPDCARTDALRQMIASAEFGNGLLGLMKRLGKYGLSNVFGNQAHRSTRG